MKKGILSVFMLMFVLCAWPTVPSYALNYGVETMNDETVHSVTGVIEKDRKTVARAAFKNVATGQIEPEAIGWGTIDCYNAGNHWMDCAWNITSSSRITYLNVDVNFSSGGSNGYNYPINPPSFTVGSTAEEYIDIPGEYFAVLEGSVTTYSGTYALVPILGDDVYMD